MGEGIQIEPTMRVQIGFRKRVKGKSLLTPVMPCTEKAVEFIARLTKETSGKKTRIVTGQIDKFMQQAHVQAETGKTEAVNLEKKLLDAVARELTARNYVRKSESVEDELLSKLRSSRAHRTPLR